MTAVDGKTVQSNHGITDFRPIATAGWRVFYTRVTDGRVGSFLTPLCGWGLVGEGRWEPAFVADDRLLTASAWPKPWRIIVLAPGDTAPDNAEIASIEARVRADIAVVQRETTR